MAEKYLRFITDIFRKPLLKRRIKIKVYKDMISALNIRDVTRNDILTTLKAFLAHEDWISSKSEREHKIFDIANQYNVLLKNQGGEVYEIYRHELLYHVMNALGYGDIYLDLWNTFEGAYNNNLAETEQFCNNDNIDNDSFVQRTNAWIKLIAIVDSEIKKEDKVRFFLDSYKDYYEINNTYFRLAQLWGLKINGKYTINPFSKEYYYGKNHLSKGRVINQYFPNTFLDTSLHDKLLFAYDVKLRNMCGHNSYEVVGNGQIIRSLKERYEISYDNLLRKMNILIHLNNALYWIILRYVYYSRLKDFADRGVVAFGFANGNLNTVFLFQLVIFEEYDYSKKWLDKISFELKENRVYVYVSENKYPVIIPYSRKFSKWYKIIKGRECPAVIFPIMPPLGVSNRLIEMDGFKYEILGDIKIKFVKIEENANL